MRHTFTYLFIVLIVFYSAVPYVFAQERFFWSQNGLVTEKTTAVLEVPELRGLHLGRGLTIALYVQLPPSQSVPMERDEKGAFCNLDAFASKGSDYVFARRRDGWVDQLYFNYKCDGKWAVPMQVTARIPEWNEWVHVAVTAEYFKVVEQGLEGYIITMYVNGEPMSRQVNSSGVADSSDSMFLIGQGIDLRGDFWGCRGKIADFFAADYPLSEDEINTLMSNSQLVKPPARDRNEPSPEAVAALRKIADGASPSGKWLARSVENLLPENGDENNNTCERLLSAVTASAAESNPVAMARQWNTHVTGYRLVATKGLLMLTGEGACKNGYPLAGLYDLRRQRPVLGRVPLSWKIHGIKDSTRVTLCSGTLPWKATIEEKEGCSYGTATWQTEDGMTISMPWTLKDNRLELNLAIENNCKDFLLEEIEFPIVRLPQLQDGIDFLLYPCQSGIAYPNPAKRRLPPRRNYPQGDLNMQFTAYYDSKGGIYMGIEDSDATLKTYQFQARGGEFESVWSFPVASLEGQNGGNSFKLPGKCAFETFDGSWLEAGRIYRRFVSTQAPWWTRELPRQDTPQWFRENCMTFLKYIRFTTQWWQPGFDVTPRVRETIREAKLMRDYLEMPFQIFFFGWEDRFKGCWPHFLPYDGFMDVVAPLKELGVEVMIYTNPRRWTKPDGPGRKSDWMYTSHGEPSAIRTRDGNLHIEDKFYVAMCPSALIMRDHVLGYTKRLLDAGFNNLYHDQVAASPPFPCFASNHGHRLNDPNAWNRDGYWRLFKDVAVLRKSYPRLVQTGEDAAENVIGSLDGLVNWRWLDEFQVPLFSSIYAGRVQFSGTRYSDNLQEDVFYVKSCLNLVWGQQLGNNMQFGMIMNHPAMRMHLKRLMHLRKSLVSWFNDAEFDGFLEFAEPIRLDTKTWWDFRGSHPVTHPQVLHTIWRRHDASRMIIFVNTSREPVLLRPLSSLNDNPLARCNGEWKVSMLGQNVPSVALKPLGFEIWLTGRAATTEATTLQDALMRIDSFKEGVLPGDPPLADSGNFNFPYEFTLYGDGGHCYRTWPLSVASGATYDITCEMRKMGEAAATPANRCLATGFKSADDKRAYTRVAVFGEDVPTDGKWHPVNGTFNVKGDFSEWTIGLYNQMAPLDSDISIRNLKIRRRPELSGDATSCTIDGLVSIQGDGKFNFRSWRLPLVNGRRYRLSFEIRRSGPPAKDKALQAVIVGRKTTEKFIRVAQLGTDIPFDAEWHSVSGDFTAKGADGDEWRVGVYNCHAASDSLVEVRRQTVVQLP